MLGLCEVALDFVFVVRVVQAQDDKHSVWWMIEQMIPSKSS